MQNNMQKELRDLIRKEIQNILSENVEKNQTEEPADNRADVLTKINSAYTRALRNNLQDVSSEELADAFMDIMNSLGYERGQKIGVLRSVKNKLQL